MGSKKPKTAKTKTAKFPTSELLAAITPLFESQNEKLRVDLRADIDKSAQQTRAEMIKDIAPMFEEIHGRLNIVSKDIHEMKQEIRAAMEIPETALLQEETVKDHGERITKVERDLDVVKTAIKITRQV